MSEQEYLNKLQRFQAISDATFGVANPDDNEILEAYRIVNSCVWWLKQNPSWPVPAAVLSESATGMYAAVLMGTE